MTLQARTVLNLIAGAVGGVLAWIVIDLTGWFVSVTIQNVMLSEWSGLFWLELLIGGILGGFISLLLGLVDALSLDSAEQRAIALASHAVVGFLGGLIGMFFGQVVYGYLQPHTTDLQKMSPFEFVQALVGHAIGWGLIGAGVGVSQGIARRSVPLIQQGLFGGLAGGLVGGVLFQSSAAVVGSGTPARLLGFVCIGASTGFFIGLIQTLFKQAWIKVVLGRNEGKEYLVTKAVTVIGRSELADIGLFGNAKIMPHHCAVEQVQSRFRLTVIMPDENTKRGQTPANVMVNGLVVSPDVWLSNGDTINIDDRTLVFHERLSRKSAAAPPPPVQAAPPPVVKSTATVKIIEGSELGRTFPVGPVASIIGRTEDCTVCLTKDTLVSRKHASVQMTNGEWTLTDNGSANGSFVNNTRLDPNATIKLRSGDHIRIGGTVLRFDL